MENSFVILPFQPENQEEVKELILNGLVEHWGRLDPSKNPDLNDIASSYAQGTFLVAWKENQIVGTGALIWRSGEIGEIVRMSVAKEFRRSGIGRLILQRLIEEAQAKGFKKIILETTNTWDEVIQFYLRCGFQITHYQDEDVYFKMELNEPG